jgi:hypothetical protein
LSPVRSVSTTRLYRKQTPEYAVEAPSISFVKEIENTTRPSAGKVMLAVFWDCEGPVLDYYQERGTTVTSVRYCNMLQNELKPVIHKKTEEYCHRVFFCCTTMPALILLHVPRKHFRNWN